MTGEQKYKQLSRIEMKIQTELVASEAWLNEPEQAQTLENINSPILCLAAKELCRRAWLHALIRHYQITKCFE